MNYVEEERNKAEEIYAQVLEDYKELSRVIYVSSLKTDTEELTDENGMIYFCQFFFLQIPLPDSEWRRYHSTNKPDYQYIADYRVVNIEFLPDSKYNTDTFYPPAFPPIKFFDNYNYNF